MKSGWSAKVSLGGGGEAFLAGGGAGGVVVAVVVETAALGGSFEGELPISCVVDVDVCEVAKLRSFMLALATGYSRSYLLEGAPFSDLAPNWPHRPVWRFRSVDSVQPAERDASKCTFLRFRTDFASPTCV